MPDSPFDTRDTGKVSNDSKKSVHIATSSDCTPDLVYVADDGDIEVKDIYSGADVNTLRGHYAQVSDENAHPSVFQSAQKGRKISFGCDSRVGGSLQNWQDFGLREFELAWTQVTRTATCAAGEQLCVGPVAPPLVQLRKRPQHPRVDP